MIVLTSVICMYLHKLFWGIVGPSVCTTKQCGQCVQLGVDDLQGPGGPAPHHQGPPTHHAAGNGSAGTQGRGSGQVRCLWCSHTCYNFYTVVYVKVWRKIRRSMIFSTFA